VDWGAAPGRWWWWWWGWWWWWWWWWWCRGGGGEFPPASQGPGMGPGRGAAAPGFASSPAPAPPAVQRHPTRVQKFSRILNSLEILVLGVRGNQRRSSSATGRSRRRFPHKRPRLAEGIAKPRICCYFTGIGQIQPGDLPDSPRPQLARAPRQQQAARHAARLGWFCARCQPRRLIASPWWVCAKIILYPISSNKIIL
jgi:hypothetical protein